MDPVSALLLIGTVIGPLLRSVAEDHVKKAFGRSLDKLGDANADALVTVADRCLREWLATGVIELMQEYEDISQCEAFLRAFSGPLETFLGDSEAREQLLGPLHNADGLAPDAGVLRARWAALGLPELPEAFSLTVIGEKYARRVRRASLVDPELRQRVLALRAEEQTGYLRALRGVWPDFDLEVYAERMRTRYRVLDLSALAPPERDDAYSAAVGLRDVFVPPRVRLGRPAREVPREIVRRLIASGQLLPDEDRRPPDVRQVNDDGWPRDSAGKSALDVIADERRIVLLGDPGAGKSTLARFILLSLLDASGSAPGWAAGLRGALPLLIELRDYALRCRAGECMGFLEYLHVLGKTQGYAMNHVELANSLKVRPTLAIFDGLDEVFDPIFRRRAMHEIVGFLTEYPLARILVTSRGSGYQGQTLREAGFVECSLLELNEAEINTFAHGWYSIVFRDQPAEARDREARIARAIRGSKSIRLLAGNPLLLTIIAIIARFQELPKDRARLYDHAVRVLCHHWDYTFHHLATAELQDEVMDDERKLALLRRVAARMQGERGFGGNAIFESDLREEIRNFFQTSLFLPPDAAERNAVAMIQHLWTRNFIICPYGPEVYGFVHRTFLEFLFASDVVRRFEKERTLDEAQLSRWFNQAAEHDRGWEILRLVCGQLSSIVAGRLIEGVAAGHLVLALQCLGEVRELGEIKSVSDLVLERALTSLLRARGDAPGAGYGLSTAIVAVGADFPTRASKLEFLPQLLETKDAHPEVVRVLWGDNERAWRTLVELGETGGAVQEVSCVLLVQAFSDHPRTRLELRRLSESEAPSVRAEVAKALALLSSTDLECRDWLTRMTGDLSERVRTHTIVQLSHCNWARALLRHLARGDRLPCVRAEAFRSWICNLSGPRGSDALALAGSEPDHGAACEMYRALAIYAHSMPISGADVDPASLSHELMGSSNAGARELGLGIACAGLTKWDRRLLTIDLDGIAPYLDPGSPITSGVLDHVALVEELTLETVRARYRELSNQLGLDLVIAGR